MKNHQLATLQRQHQEAAENFAQKIKEMGQQNASNAYEKTQLQMEGSHCKLKMKQSEETVKHMPEVYNAEPPQTIKDGQMDAINCAHMHQATPTQDFEIATPRASSAEPRAATFTEEPEER